MIPLPVSIDDDILDFARRAPFPARSKLIPSSPRHLMDASSSPGFDCGFIAAAAQIAWGCLYEAHELVQRHEGHPDADYLHALIHRFEGDAGNHRWWLRQVGRHPLHARLEAELRQIQNLPPEWTPLVKRWDGLAAANLDLGPSGVALRRYEWCLLCQKLRASQSL
ncbi:MAG: hypothetical protein RL095_1256 [Verrucomicrobiota bacterium]|jgi:hypothetical protein